MICWLIDRHLMCTPHRTRTDPKRFRILLWITLISTWFHMFEHEHTREKSTKEYVLWLSDSLQLVCVSHGNHVVNWILWSKTFLTDIFLHLNLHILNGKYIPIMGSSTFSARPATKPMCPKSWRSGIPVVNDNERINVVHAGAGGEGERREEWWTRGCWHCVWC